MKYYTFVLIGKSVKYKLWYANTWSKVFDLLNDILCNYKKETGVRTTQCFRHSNEEPRMGRLNWDQKSNVKWTLSEPMRSETQIQFFNTEIWVPRWTLCDRENIDPVIFMNIVNPFPLENYPAKTNQFNQYFQFSIREETYLKHKEELEAILFEIYRYIDGVKAIWLHTKWNDEGYSLQDALNNYVDYVGNADDLIPDKTKMMIAWHDFNIGFNMPK